MQQDASQDIIYQSSTCVHGTAGMRGVAHSSMSSLDGVTTSQRDREAAAKARASLDFSSLSDRAGKGARPPAYQRAQSADIPGKGKKHSQVVCCR